MNTKILTEIENIVVDAAQDIFDVDSNLLTRESGPHDVQDWDSIGHVRLMMSLEDSFGLRISAETALSLDSISSIANYIFNSQGERKLDKI